MSWASNLDPRDNNGRLSDVFVHDRRTGETEIVSLSSRGLALPPPPDLGLAGDCVSWSTHPSISDDGRYVAFYSLDNTLVDGDKNPTGDVFVRDRKTGSTELVSGESPYEDRPFVADRGIHGLSISGNGRYVAFSGSLTGGKLPPDPQDPLADECPAEPAGIRLPAPLFPCGVQLFVRDRAREETTLVTASMSGGLANGGNRAPSLSRTGRYVVFQSWATNLTRDDFAPTCPNNAALTPPGSCWRVFLRDLKTNETELVSLNRDGRPSAGDAFISCCTPQAGRRVSADGRFVLFESWASDLVPATDNPTPLARGTFVRDRKLNRTERVSVTSWGAISRFGGGGSALSGDGRFVGSSFFGVGPSPPPVVHDRLMGSSLESDGWDGCPSVGLRTLAAVSAEGRYLALGTDCAEVVPDDGNEASDVFVHDRGSVLGVGRIQQAVASPSRMSSSSPAGTGAVSVVGATGVRYRWADIIEARLAYRPSSADIFVRIDVDRLPAISPVPEPLFAVAEMGVYVVSFSANGARYEARVQPSLFEPGYAHFALFHCGEATYCAPAATLRGGYGTVGDNVVLALPLSELGLPTGQSLRDVRVATGFGSIEVGIVNGIDELVVPDAPSGAPRRR